MKKTIILPLILAILTPLVSGDTVETKLFPFSGVKVVGVQGCFLVFTTAGGGTTTKLIPELKRIEIKRREEFNRAENYATQKQWSKALEAYEKARKKPGKKWMKELIDIRMLGVLNELQKTQQAVDLWLKIVDRNDGSETSLTLAPTNFAPKGSKSNRHAIDALENHKSKIQQNEEYLEAVNELLMKLYQHQGEQKKAVERAAELAEGDSKKQSQTQSRDRREASSVSDSVLGSVEMLMKSGKYESALSRIENNLNRYNHDQLPAALLFRGKTQMELAQRESGDRKKELLLSAGLNFMRVVSAYPDSSQAPEALLGAGEAHLRLPDPRTDAARAAFGAVIDRYQTGDAVEEAKKQLSKLSSE